MAVIQAEMHIPDRPLSRTQTDGITHRFTLPCRKPLLIEFGALSSQVQHFLKMDFKG